MYLAPRQRRLLATASLVALAVSCAALVVVTDLVAVHTTNGRLLDGSSLRGARNSRTGLTGRLEQLLDLVSVASLVAATVVVAMIALIRLRRTLALAGVAVILGSTVTSQVLKRLVFERPDFGFYETTPATLNSLPSGHSTIAFAVVVALVMVAPTRVRAQVAVLGVVVATVLALATLSAGWHRPSDSVAAFLVVGTWAFGCGAWLVARDTGRGPADGNAGERHRTSTRLLIAAGALVAAAATLSALVITSRIDDYGTTAQVLAYVAGGSAVAGTGAAVMGAFLVMLPWIVPLDTPAEPPRPSSQQDES